MNKLKKIMIVLLLGLFIMPFLSGTLKAETNPTMIEVNHRMEFELKEGTTSNYEFTEEYADINYYDQMIVIDQYFKSFDSYVFAPGPGLDAYRTNPGYVKEGVNFYFTADIPNLGNTAVFHLPPSNNIQFLDPEVDLIGTHVLIFTLEMPEKLYNFIYSKGVAESITDDIPLIKAKEIELDDYKIFTKTLNFNDQYNQTEEKYEEVFKFFEMATNNNFFKVEGFLGEEAINNNDFAIKKHDEYLEILLFDDQDYIEIECYEEEDSLYYDYYGSLDNRNFELTISFAIHNSISDHYFQDGINSVEVNEDYEIFKAPNIVLDWHEVDGFETELFYGSNDFHDGFYRDITDIAAFTQESHIDMSVLALNYNKVIYPGHDRFFPFWFFNCETEQLEFYNAAVTLSRIIDYAELENINIDDVLNQDPGQIFNQAYDKGLFDGKQLGFNEAKEIFGVFYNGEWITAAAFGDIKFTEGYDEGESVSFGIGYDEAKQIFGIYYNNEWLKAVDYGDIFFDYGFTDGKEEYGILHNGTWLTATAYGDVMFNAGIEYAENQMPVGHRVEFYIDEQLYFSIGSEDLFVMPPTPTKEDHVFIGWYFKDTEQVFNITNHDFTEDIQLVAKFNTSGSGGAITESDKPSKTGVIIFASVIAGVLILASIPLINELKKKKGKKK